MKNDGGIRPRKEKEERHEKESTNKFHVEEGGVISYISREPMNLAEVIVTLPEWRPFKTHHGEGLTNGTSYAYGGEFIASDGKAHVGFDFFQLSQPASRQGAEEFQKHLDLVSDCSSGADLDLFYALVSDPVFKIQQPY